MLQPARTKYRKQQKGRNTGVATRGNKVSFGEYGLKATTRGRLTARQLEAGAPRHVAPHQARRPHLDPGVPGQADLAASPPKCAWATARAIRSTSSARSSRARSFSRWTASTEALAKEAFALASAKLPFRTIVRAAHAGRLEP